ncbi:nSTAND1 domain-containing NTPase [Lentzea flava]|uniref:nSTAND1 domain-containing NTPase n=1 Tax=Lentzea flava TaxID=103732 RepID=UPI001670DA1D|nr:TIR domain-containing protein [Lentzea flava]MCP2201918.1 WD40 repeat [Lentzea flava]
MGRIFLSYHGHDEGNDIALHLRDALLAAGYEDVHAYTAPGSGPDVSRPWKDSLRRELLGADALIVVTSPGSYSEWCTWESSIFRERKPHAPCIEFFSARSQNRAILDDLQAQRVDHADAASLAAARDTALLVLERAGVTKAATTTSPFPGLKAFDEHQASLFFGRDDDTQRLAQPLLGRRESGALAVIGPSGAGKSSLVRAGLIPLLRRAGWTIIGPLTPSQGVLPAIEGPGRRLVVLDQTEELLIGDSTTLVRRLVAASRGEAWVVHTVRADFLDDLMRHEDLEPLFRDNFLVAPLAKAEIPVVVNGPLRALGWSVDDAALGLIQEDASRESLPLLAFALENLWRHVNRDGERAPRPITRAEYVASGRVMDVLRQQADEALAMARDLVREDDGSWPKAGEAERRVLRTLRTLVSVDEGGKFTKRAVAVAELSADERQLLAPFITNRVLTATHESIEVAHESLFLRWPRLRESLERDHAALRARREIEDIAKESVKHPDQLIAPSRLASLLSVLSPADDAFAEMRPQHLSADAQRLLQLSSQQKVDDDVRRAVALDPVDALQVLAGDDFTVRLLPHAPDLSSWRLLLLRAMASTHRLRSFSGHTAGIWGVDWSPDDTKLVTGSKDGTVRVWDSGTAACLHVFSHGTGPCWVRSVAWSPNGDVVASVATDATLRLWSPREEREIRVIPLPGLPWSVRFNATGDRVLVGCADGGVYLWDVACRNDAPVHAVRAVVKNDEQNTVRLWDADISSDGRWIAIARDDGRVALEGVGHRLTHALSERHWTDAAARSVRFHPHDPEIWASGDGRSTAVLDRPIGQTHLRGHSDGVRRVSWSPCGTRIASASADGTARVWDAVTGRELLCLRGHHQGVCDVAWSHEGDQLATVAEDGTQRAWKIGSEPTANWFYAKGEVLALARNPVSGELTIGLKSLIDPIFNGQCSLAWTPNGQRLAIGSDDGVVTIQDQDGALVAQLAETTDEIDDLQWSSDGTLLAAVSRDRTWLPRVYSRDGELLTSATWTRHSGNLTAVAWHPHRQIFAVAGEGNVTVNSMDRTLYSFVESKWFTSIAWHPEHDVLAAGCADATIVLFRLTDDLVKIGELHGHADEIRAMAWSPDGRSLLSASSDATARVWDPVTSGQRTALLGHGDAVTAALWLPDGTVVTGSRDRTVRYWDVSDGFTRPLSGTARGDDVGDLITEARLRIS